MSSAASSKQSLAVAALKDGTVIDHIPSHSLFKAVRILGIENMGEAVTIGNNLASSRLGRKGIIKVANVEFEQATLNRIALIAPTAKVNIIRDYEVVEKHQVVLPDEIVDIVRCSNPKCISNNEPMASRFEVVERDGAEGVVIRCRYCNQATTSQKATIK